MFLIFLAIRLAAPPLFDLHQSSQFRWRRPERRTKCQRVLSEPVSSVGNVSKITEFSIYLTLTFASKPSLIRNSLQLPVLVPIWAEAAFVSLTDFPRFSV